MYIYPTDWPSLVPRPFCGNEARSNHTLQAGMVWHVYIPYRLAWRGMCGVTCCSCAPTPGTGKSLTASEVCSRTGMRHVDVGLVAKQQNLYDGFDKQYQCPILDEDKVCVEC